MTDLQGKVLVDESINESYLNLTGVARGLYIIQLFDESGELLKQQKQLME